MGVSKQVMLLSNSIRDGSRTAGTSTIERFVIIVKCWKPLTIITKCSILDVAATLDPPLIISRNFAKNMLYLRDMANLTKIFEVKTK